MENGESIPVRPPLGAEKSCICDTFNIEIIPMVGNELRVTSDEDISDDMEDISEGIG